MKGVWYYCAVIDDDFLFYSVKVVLKSNNTKYNNKKISQIIENILLLNTFFIPL